MVLAGGVLNIRLYNVIKPRDYIRKSLQRSNAGIFEQTEWVLGGNHIPYSRPTFWRLGGNILAKFILVLLLLPCWINMHSQSDFTWCWTKFNITLLKNTTPSISDFTWCSTTQILKIEIWFSAYDYYNVEHVFIPVMDRVISWFTFDIVYAVW